MDKFGSVIDRMNMKLGSKFLSSLIIKTQLPKRLQCVIVVDGATHSQKDGVKDNRGSLKDGAEAFKLVLRGAQLVLRFSVITVLNLDEMDITFNNTDTLGWCC
jgi:aspartate carbamoyltransferase regulatory subunit